MNGGFLNLHIQFNYYFLFRNSPIGERKNILEGEVESGHSLRAILLGDYLRQCEVIFCTPGNTILNMLQRVEITFDVAMFDNAGGINEFWTWWMALPLVLTSL